MTKTLFERMAEAQRLEVRRMPDFSNHRRPEPLVVPPRLFEAAARDPRYADACRRGDIIPAPMISESPDVDLKINIGDQPGMAQARLTRRPRRPLTR
jgi:hypothetical protein